MAPSTKQASQRPKTQHIQGSDHGERAAGRRRSNIQHRPTRIHQGGQTGGDMSIQHLITDARIDEGRVTGITPHFSEQGRVTEIGAARPPEQAAPTR